MENQSNVGHNHWTFRQKYLLFYAQKLNELLQKRIATTKNTDLKAHYMLLQKRVKKMLS